MKSMNWLRAKLRLSSVFINSSKGANMLTWKIEYSKIQSHVRFQKKENKVDIISMIKYFTNKQLSCCLRDLFIFEFILFIKYSCIFFLILFLIVSDPYQMFGPTSSRLASSGEWIFIILIIYFLWVVYFHSLLVCSSLVDRSEKLSKRFPLLSVNSIFLE